MAYVNGNLALQPKRKPEQKPSFRETKKVVIKRKSLPVQEKLLYLFTILIGVIVAGVIIFRYAQIYQMELQIKELTAKQAVLEKQISTLTSEKERLNDPAVLRGMAMSQNMTDPTDESKPLQVKVPDGADRESASAKK
ncbi:cell division initiation protein [Paenibacillus sp. R14(2021)]|uniref:cell division initiation protein n=1 Tax=Paenibacillus sp. R14(2021) TaxID=2859228 RepID=UPI001C612F1A|nr:cell division initiation protein [Paenibacillus sp. R14(2021)]